jgi:hypothetical protein
MLLSYTGADTLAQFPGPDRFHSRADFYQYLAISKAARLSLNPIDE